jgi:hypothetical protein
MTIRVVSPVLVLNPIFMSIIAVATKAVRCFFGYSDATGQRSATGAEAALERTLSRAAVPSHRLVLWL